MSWWKYAKAGDKVVCVIDHDCFGKKVEFIFLGEEYTILAVELFKREITHSSDVPVCFNVGYPWATFNAGFFRPIQTRSTETGMSILKSILNGADIKEGVEA